MSQPESLLDLPSDAVNLTITEAPIFSVSELAFHLKKTVESTYKQVKVRGEISGFKHHTSGHRYFALKDRESVIDAVSWKGMLSKVQLQDGMEVIATGRLTTYPGRSKYQMIVESVELAGQGALLKLLEDRKNKLSMEGLFDPQRKKNIPFFPTCVGVITSPTGAVIQDILHRFWERFPCQILLWPVLVQGQGAAEQITAAIQGFNALTTPPDTLIVARGGGSLEDLWAFNEEMLVRAVANSRIPIISAVGHETDVTLIDYAADRRAPTPTAAAEMASPVWREIRSTLIDRSRRLDDAVALFLDRRRMVLTAAQRGLPDLPQILSTKIQRLDEWGERLQNNMQGFLSRPTLHLTTLSQRLRHPQDIILQAEKRLEGLERHLSLLWSQHWKTQTQRWAHLSERLGQASFQKVLDRGFCMVTDPHHRPITSIHQGRCEDVLSLHFKDGILPVVSAEKVSDPLLQQAPEKQKDKRTAHQASVKETLKATQQFTLFDTV